MKKLLSIFLALVMLLSVVPALSPAYAAGTSDKKVLRVAFRGDPNTLCHITDPVASANTATHQLMMDRLFDYDSETGAAIPMLATGWEVIDDTHFRITLRSDVYSWNGDKFKASDVRYTIQSAVNSGKHDRYYGNFDVANFVVEDDTHIVIALKKKDPFIKTTLSNIPYGMLCEASVNAGGGLEKMNGLSGVMPNCYTGPYIPVEWNQGEYIKFEKNADYWGGEPYYDEVVIYSVADAQQRDSKLMSGEVDLVVEPYLNDSEAVSASSDLEVYALPTTQQITLMTNTTRAPFDDVNLRIACALALNYDSNIQVAVNGYAEHSDDILPKTSSQYSSPASEGYESYFHYDLNKAKQFMAKSKYAGTGPTVEIYYTTASTQFSSYAALIQQQWEKIGINVTLLPIAQSEFFSTMSTGDYQAYIVSNSNPNPYEQLKFYDGEHYNYKALNGGPQWNGGSEVTALFDQITAEPDFANATPYYKALRKIINQNVPSIPLYTNHTLVYGVKGLKGLGLTEVGDPYFAKVKMADAIPTINSLVNGDTNSGITVKLTGTDGYSKFRIQRKAGSGSWTTVTSAATGTSYKDTKATVGGTTYSYRVSGYKNGAWSDYSEAVSIVRNPFTDVKTSASYFKALCWAYNNGIVAGTSTTKFSPNDNCTRGQFALMLWRMNGKPSTAGLENPFTDVKSSNGFYNGIVWCYNQGITAGTSATTFSPNNNISRWQMILMFWRMQGKPKSSITTNPFTDVKESASYYKAALWAYEKKITAVETFKPNDLCTRWQLVLFLYRLNNLYNYI